MKEFIKKLIGRFEKESHIKYDQLDDGYCFDAEHFIYTSDAIRIVNELAEEQKHDMVTQLAMMYAKNIYVYGVDVTKAWESAVQNHMALEKAYIRGRQDESDKFSEWREEHGEVMNKLLDSLHTKILKSKFAEEVTEEEIDALVKAKEYNGDWIPCSVVEHPEHCKSCEVTVKYITGYERDIAFYTDKWRRESDEVPVNVVAWKEVSEPYQQKGE